MTLRTGRNRQLAMCITIIPIKNLIVLLKDFY